MLGLNLKESQLVGEWGSKMEGGSDNLTFHDSKGYDPNKVTSATLP